jgi:hypothetical protein
MRALRKDAEIWSSSGRILICPRHSAAVEITDSRRRFRMYSFGRHGRQVASECRARFKGGIPPLIEVSYADTDCAAQSRHT